MDVRRVVVTLCGLGVLGVLAGCMGAGSVSTQPVQPVSVLFVDAPPSSLAVNASATLMAGVTNQPANNAITWTVTCGSAGACGTFSAAESVTGSPVTYKAPAAIPAGGTVTITATSAQDPAKSVSQTVTITSPQPIAVTFFAPVPASVQVGTSLPLSASIANDVSANPQVTWTATCGSSACGSFSTGATASEAQTTYTAPAAVPTGGTVTVTATSQTDPTKSASATIAIMASTAALANGTYVFQVASPAMNAAGAGSASFTAGAFTAQNGTVTGGEMDSTVYGSGTNGNRVEQPLHQTITGGSYAVNAAGEMTVNLQIGADETYPLTGMVTADGKGFVAQIQGAGGTGTLSLQTSTAAPAGGYAFSLYGGDSFAVAASIGGVINVDGAGAISGSGSVLDVTDGTLANGEGTLAASTVSSPDAFGRVLFKLTPVSLLPSLYLAGYVVDATHIRLIEVGGDLFQGVMAGVAFGQGSNTGHFSSASLAGSTYVIAYASADTHGFMDVAGLMTANASGGVSGVLSWNDQSGNQPSTPDAFTGTYTVDSTGRVTLTDLTDGPNFQASLHMYLSGSGDALLVGSSAVTVGQAFEQQAGTFSAASLSGSYGLSAQTYSNANGKNDVVLASIASAANGGTDAWTGFADMNKNAADVALSGSLTASANGAFTGTVTGLEPASATASGNFAVYMIDNTRGVMIETDNSDLLLGTLALTQ